MSAALRAVGVNMDWGSVPDAFDAVIDNINAHGGINGRKIVPYIVAVNPVGHGAGGHGVHAADRGRHRLRGHRAARGHVLPRARHAGRRLDLPVGQHRRAWPRTSPPRHRLGLRPLQLSVFDKQGVFRHKKVALFGGDLGDESELALVQSALAKLHVPVVTTAVDSAPQGDMRRGEREVTAIAQRFQSDGVNEVVAVGDGSAVWPEGLSAIQSTYNPPWVATSESDFTGAVGG